MSNPYLAAAKIFFSESMPPVMDAFTRMAAGYGVEVSALEGCIKNAQDSGDIYFFNSGEYDDRLAAEAIRQVLERVKKTDGYPLFYYEAVVRDRAVEFSRAPLLCEMEDWCRQNYERAVVSSPYVFDPIRQAVLGVFMHCCPGPWFLLNGIHGVDELNSRYFQVHSRHFPAHTIDAQEIDRDPSVAVMQLIARFVNREALESVHQAHHADMLKNDAGEPTWFANRLLMFRDQDRPMTAPLVRVLHQCFMAVKDPVWDVFIRDLDESSAST